MQVCDQEAHSAEGRQLIEIVIKMSAEKNKSEENEFFFSLENEISLEPEKERIIFSNHRGDKKNLKEDYWPFHRDDLDSKVVTTASLISKDGEVVTIPLLFIWFCPKLAEIACEVSTWDISDVCISLPGSMDEVKSFRELLVTGCIPSIGKVEQTQVQNIVKGLGLGFYHERRLKEDIVPINEPVSFVMEESLEEEEEEEEEDHITQFWKSSAVPETHVRENGCSPTCLNGCSGVADAWNPENIKSMFSGARLFWRKNKLIKHLAAQGNIGLSTDGYIIQSHKLCVKYMSVLTGISEYILHLVLKDYLHGISHYQHGNRGKFKQPSVATITFIGWFKQFLSLYGQDAPDQQLTVLPYWLKGKALYKIYIEEVSKPRIALRTFYQHLDTYFGPQRIDHSFPRVKISKYSSHSVCDTCTALNANQKLCSSEAELNMVMGLHNLHKLDYSLARKTVQSIKQSSLNFPRDNLMIMIDGMDNSKVRIAIQIVDLYSKALFSPTALTTWRTPRSWLVRRGCRRRSMVV